MVLCSFCHGVSLKFIKKNGRASTLPARITWAYFWPLLEFAGQDLKVWIHLRKATEISDYSSISGTYATLPHGLKVDYNMAHT